MSNSRIHEAEQFEGAEITLMDVVRGRGRVPITPLSVETLTYSVIECEDRDQAIAANGETIVDAVELVVDDQVFSPLTTGDGTWTKDDDGYNFRYDSPPSDRPTGGTWHRYEFVFTPAIGNPFAVVWIVNTLPMAST